jgi:hypothetical protein
MRPPPPLGPSFFARWTSRIALFSVGVLAAAIFLHRLFSLPSPIAFNLAAVAFLGAALALIFAMLASIGIWRTGRPGTPRIVFGTIVGLGLLLWPLVYWPQYNGLPEIYDLTTDPVSPPAFETLAKQRGPGANPLEYPGAAFAAAQAAAYPDIKAIEINRPVDDSFEIAADAIRRLKLEVVRQEAPDMGTGRPGFIEIADRSLVIGFYDDVILRVAGDAEQARIDVRSASRYGAHDLGRNAERIRMILKEIVVRLESVVPVVRGGAKAKDDATEEEPRRNRRPQRRRRQ